MTRCPICSFDWPNEPTRCVCGYDFETGSTEEVVRVLVRQRRAANRRWLGGLVTFASSAITVALAALYPTMLIALPIILAVQVLFGLGLVASGLGAGWRVGRQLSRVRTMHQLPAARIVKH